MSVSFARRLLARSDVRPETLHRALWESRLRGASLIEALLAIAPELLEALEQELGSGSRWEPLELNRELLELLPPGFAERMLAFPSGVSADGHIEMLAVDAEDPHLRAELEAHLDQPFRLQPVALRSALTAAGIRTFEKVASDRPLVRVSASRSRPSDPPIPLVRKTDRTTKGRVSTSPGLGRHPTSAPPELPELRPTPAALEGRLVASASAADVAEVIAWAGGPGSLVFAVGPEQLVLVAAALATPAPELELARGGPSVLQRALEDGDYQGPLFDCVAHELLRPWIGPGEPVFAASVLVAERPVFVFLLKGAPEPASVARYGQRIAAAAAKCLELLIVRRKRSPQS